MNGGDEKINTTLVCEQIRLIKINYRFTPTIKIFRPIFKSTNLLEFADEVDGVLLKYIDFDAPNPFIDTFGRCFDVTRNVVRSPLPESFEFVWPTIKSLLLLYPGV